MRLSLFLLICLLWQAPSAAQSEIGALVSEKIKSRYKIEEVFELDNGEILAVGRDPRGIPQIAKYSDLILLKFSKDLTLIKQYKDKMELEKKRLKNLGVKKVGKNYYLFFSFDNTKDKKNYLFSRKIDVENLELTENIKVIGYVPLKNGEFKSTYVFNSSDSDENLLITAEKKATKKTLNFQLNGWLVDANMNILEAYQNINVKKHDSTKGFSIYKTMPVENGVAVLLQSRPFGRYEGRVVKNRKLIVMLFKDNGDTLLHIPQLKEGQFTDLAISLSPEGKIVVGGPYSLSARGANGIYMAELDINTLGIITEYNIPFRQDFINEANSAADSLYDTLKEVYGDYAFYYEYAVTEKAFAFMEEEDYDDEYDNVGSKKKKSKKDKSGKEPLTIDKKIKNEKMGIPMLSKALGIVFNEYGKPVLILEKQNEYTVFVWGTGFNGTGKAMPMLVPVAMPGYGDLVIASPETDTTLNANYILTFHGDRSSPEAGHSYICRGDKMFIRHDYKISAVDLNTLTISTTSIPYLAQNLHLYYNKEYKTFTFPNKMSLCKNGVLSIEKQKKQKLLKLTF